MVDPDIRRTRVFILEDFDDDDDNDDDEVDFTRNSDND